MDLDLADIPLVDAHCHFFDVRPAGRDPKRVLSLSLEGPRAEDLASTLVYRTLIGELGRLLGVEGEAAVLRRREALVAEDYGGYVATLMEDIRLEGLVLDMGYAPAAVDRRAFEALVRVPVRYLLRIETLVDPFLRQPEGDFDAFEEAFEGALAGAPEDAPLAGYKTIVAYRTGLEVGTPTRAEAREAHREGREKPVRDYFIGRTLEACRERGLPLQVHTGFGESNLFLPRSNPVLLKGLLEAPIARGVPLVLVHGGYPYTFEAAYMAAAYPHVYVDFSEVVPFAPRRAREAIGTLLDGAPMNKVMYGSDGFLLPELHWLGGRLARRHLAAVLGDLVEGGHLGKGEARQTAEAVLHGTAEGLYGFPRGAP